MDSVQDSAGVELTFDEEGIPVVSSIILSKYVHKFVEEYQIEQEELEAEGELEDEVIDLFGGIGMFGNSKLEEWYDSFKDFFQTIPQASLVEFKTFKDNTGFITVEVEMDWGSSKAVNGITTLAAWEATFPQAMKSIKEQYIKIGEEDAAHAKFLEEEKKKQIAQNNFLNNEMAKAAETKDLKAIEDLLRSVPGYKEETIEATLNLYKKVWQLT